eukprot:scaffold171509_cov33-Tisochrysis_lutea.AAC.2
MRRSLPSASAGTGPLTAGVNPRCLLAMCGASSTSGCTSVASPSPTAGGNASLAGAGARTTSTPVISTALTSDWQMESGSSMSLHAETRIRPRGTSCPEYTSSFSRVDRETLRVWPPSDRMRS